MASRLNGVAKGGGGATRSVPKRFGGHQTVQGFPPVGEAGAGKNPQTPPPAPGAAGERGGGSEVT